MLGPVVHNVQDINVPVPDPTGEVTARMYSPESKTPVPLHFNMHGGGWVLGGLTSEQAWCRHIVNNIGIKVVDIDYRLAPEFRFPVAIYDCWTVIKFVSDFGLRPLIRSGQASDKPVVYRTCR